MGDEAGQPRHNHLTQMITPGCLACMAPETIKTTQELRCPWAIRFGVVLHTRCDKLIGHLAPGLSVATRQHRGNGLAEFPYQRISWLPGDSREYLTQRNDKYAWEEGNDGAS